PRKLIGSSSRSPRTMALLEINKDIKLGAMTVKNQPEMIDWHTLPKAITTPAATIQRADLVPAPNHISPMTPMPLKQLEHWQ
ncbi:hypothetical protein, partial [Pseudomaricurvus sp.]|uniref:hypothetical protein n=1 Tax=Pseudomaricurvus sp. TaxID=2004510 RepID=UPI003F6C2FD5